MQSLSNEKQVKTAAILVGGKGTRLQPLISHVPKPLAPVGDEPFLFLLIRALLKVGYQNIVLLTGYRHEAIVEACQSDNAPKANFYYSRELTPLGTAGALKQAQKYLSSCAEFLLLNGDTYLDDFVTLARTPLKDNFGLMGVIKPKENDRYGSVLFDAESKRILSFQEKNPLVQCYVNAGIYKFSPAILAEIPPHQFCSLENDILPLLISQHRSLCALPLHGQFYDIGLPESYLQFVEAH
ncbi:MAG: NTP transferase domain-containing protein [Gammaproteobacteria bacterium]|nr:NTP transferase domain-containing protein [Gammaproteobacteria bacterium]